ncbi:hypothetical protein DNTS_002180 [Danionella cerebrum]|uniref:Ig-like domain-containing protein n=1 Tax=Danionella cerebrum TaxID=2873325 RepID=A0A553N201_9TELE|nr:hypothetical protein DNTS_002180 [Danionella translucida]
MVSGKNPLLQNTPPSDLERTFRSQAGERERERERLLKVRKHNTVLCIYEGAKENELFKEFQPRLSSCVEIITMRRRITIHFEEKLKRRVLGLLLALAMRFCISESGVSFVESPRNFTLSLGKLVSLRCALRVDPDLDWDPDAVNPELEESFQDPQGPPELRWLRDGEILEDADTDHMQIPQEPSGWLVRSTLRIEEVQLSDMGGYQCMFYSGSEEMLSMEGFIQLEGLPVFSLEPQSLSVEVNQALSLHCEARGPPEPVHIIWLQDGAPLNSLDDPIALSPSTLRLPGLNRSSSFSLIPSPPSNIVAEEISNSSLQLSWVPGFGGEYPISLCSLQRPHFPSVLGPNQCVSEQTRDSVPKLHPEESVLFWEFYNGFLLFSAEITGGMTFRADAALFFILLVRDTEEDLVWDEQVTALDSSTLVSNLLPFSEYDIRVSCRSSQGQSTWSQWVSISTSEGAGASSALSVLVTYDAHRVFDGFLRLHWLSLILTPGDPWFLLTRERGGNTIPDSSPENLTVLLNGTEVMMSWAEPSGRINGRLQGYVMEYSTPNTHRVILDVGLDKELMINLSEPLSNISFRVFAYTSAGAGPWTLQQTVTLTQSETGLSRGSSPTGFSWHWWYVVMAVCVCVALAVLLAVYATRLRHKETRFGEAFEPMMERGELVVRYRARRTYSRRTTEATRYNSRPPYDTPRPMAQSNTTQRQHGPPRALGQTPFRAELEPRGEEEVALMPPFTPSVCTTSTSTKPFLTAPDASPDLPKDTVCVVELPCCSSIDGGNR